MEHVLAFIAESRGKCSCENLDFTEESMGAGDEPHIFTILHRMTLYMLYMRSALAICREKADFWKS